MAKTFSQIRLMLNEVQGPDPKPAMPKGPNGHSNVVREEDEVDEAYRPSKGPVVGNSLGKIENQNGRTMTGDKAPTVTSEPIVPSLTGYH